MSPDEKNASGNACNPSPQAEEPGYAGPDQLIDKKGEKYLREAGNIEDMPDAEEEQEAEKIRKQESGSAENTNG